MAGRENMDRHFYKLESVRRVLTPSPLAYGLYARENVDNCERPLRKLPFSEKICYGGKIIIHMLKEYLLQNYLVLFLCGTHSRLGEHEPLFARM